MGFSPDVVKTRVAFAQSSIDERYKSLALGKYYGFGKVIQSPKLLDKVRDDWRALRPLVDWVAARVDMVG